MQETQDRKNSLHDLPTAARGVLLAVCLGAVGAAWGADHLRVAHGAYGMGELALFLVLNVIASRKKVQFLARKTDNGNATISLGVVVTFAVLFKLGIGPALLCDLIGIGAAAVLSRKQTWYQLLFNGSQQLLQVIAAGVIFVSLNHGWVITSASAVPVIVTAAAYFTVNSSLLAAIIAASTGQPLVPLWRAQFLWLAPSYLAAACAGALGVYLSAHRVGGFVLLALPLAYPLYQNYAMRVGQAAEKQQHSEHLAGLYLATIKSLALAVDAKDQYTHQHILRVQRYAVATARQMNLPASDLEGVTTGALLHDIGKIGIPDAILLKPGRLTEEEFALVRQHPTIGAQILGPVEFPWPVLPVVKYHHEKWDGTGYPEGLSGEDIPLTARVLAVADVYDALTSNRSYRNAWTHEKALAEIERGAGTHFDARIVAAFLRVIDPVRAEMAAEGMIAPPEAVPAPLLAA